MSQRPLLLTLLISLTVILNSYCQQQIENPGFEYWEEIGFGPDTLEPVNWSSLKTSDGGDIINNVIPVVWEQSTDAHSGMYSVKLINMPILTMVAPGTLTNGRVHATLPPSDAYVFTIDSLPEFNTPFTGFPDSLRVWAKFFPDSIDIGHVIAILHTDTAKIADSLQTNWIAVANIDFADETSDWTKFEAPFVYLNTDTPQYILFAIYAGDAENSLEGSILYLDDFELIYNNTSVQSTVKDNINIYSLNNQIVVNLCDENLNGTSVMTLHDISGKVVFTHDIIFNQTNKFNVNIPSGVYICRIQGSSLIYSQKLIIKPN
ncbi:MAG: T9SS type A sorting domain-containing protein [Bacteroidales bacterium]|nr:T9SS type A sorting domain-containing protein [Bacteroidales bacterium]